MKLVKLEGATIPEYKTAGAAGMDLYANITEPIELAMLDRAMVPTGIKIQLEPGYEAQIRPRSGKAIKEGLSVINTPGTIDFDYRGEIMVGVVNLSKDMVTIQPQERIAQMVINKYQRVEIELVNELDSTERGECGFGSTGKN